MKLLLILGAFLFVLTQCASTEYSTNTSADGSEDDGIADVHDPKTNVNINGHWILLKTEIIEPIRHHTTQANQEYIPFKLFSTSQTQLFVHSIYEKYALLHFIYIKFTRMEQ